MSTSGADFLQLAAKHIGEKYHLGIRVPKDNAKWTGPWDCAEFVSWVVFQSSEILYGCFNNSGNPATADAFTGFWDRDAAGLGHIVTIEEAGRTPGAAVLRRPQAGGIGHVVLSDGKGGTIEAHCTKDGVIRYTLAGRRWDFGILVPGIDYTAGAKVTVASPPATIFRLAVPPMSGPVVKQIQKKLKTKGFDPGTVDGVFGPHTQAAVTALQLSLGLNPDGEVGPITAKALAMTL